MGMLPFYEEVVDVNAKRQLERKVKIQDYIYFCDLHLPSRGSILRVYDNGYEFQQGVAMTVAGVAIAPQSSQNTIRINWNNLLTWMNEKLPEVRVWSDFTPFAETALDQTELLNQIPAHINLLRRGKTYWDSAFQLYSGVIFVKTA
jgi:hypothetical protein